MSLEALSTVAKDLAPLYGGLNRSFYSVETCVFILTTQVLSNGLRVLQLLFAGAAVLFLVALKV